MKANFPFLNLKKNLYYYCLYLILIIFFALLLCQPIDFTVQDIGRHITNGQEILKQNWSVLNKNYYSYTLPDAEFVNHHWLSGVIFALISNNLELKVLHLFHILLYTGSLFFLFKIFQQKSNHFLSIFLGLPAVLLLSLRAEIRPETFGYFFLCHSLWQLEKILNNKKISIKTILLLLVQQLLWVNLHISFIFGIFVFAVTTIIQKIKQKKWAKTFFILSLGLILISLVNPHFFQGLIQPLLIFHDYGYKILENQNLWFLHKVLSKQIIWIWIIFLFSFLGLTFKNFKFNETFIFALCGLGLSFSALRNIPFLVIFLFPYLSQQLKFICESIKKYFQITSFSKKFLLFIILFLGILASYSDRIKNKIKLGDLPGQNQAAYLFQEKNLKGPIFNNYDLGSYLIYHLYPEERVFTDNRPEAYNGKFFQKTYIPMQNNPEIWQQMEQKYNFQTIFFGTRDLTPWGQKFLYLIKQNPHWQLTYEDQFCLIMTKKSEAIPEEK